MEKELLKEIIREALTDYNKYMKNDAFRPIVPEIKIELIIKENDFLKNLIK
jgi:hypothetical protein